MSIMRKTGLLVGVIGSVAALASAAEGGEGGKGKHWRGPPPVVYVPQQQVFVAPPPVVYAPAQPLYYAPAPPMYYDGPASPSLNINIPLR